MKMKKKSNVVAMALCLSVFAVFAMGSGSSSSGADKDISSVSTTTSSTKESTVESTSDSATEIAKDEANLSEITIDEQVLYDENDIKITAKGIEDGWLGTELKLLIENNSTKSITVQARNANVNGYMVDTMMSADVAAGKKANDSLTFETSGLKECGIESIATMEFYFYIFDAETWDEIVSTDVITVETSIADSYVQTYDDSGEVLVDTAGVKIIGKGLSVDDSFWGPGVILYIENNTDKDITVQVRDVSVNGFMVDSTMSEDVVSGKKAMSAVQFFSSDLEENSIEDITDVELYFHIFDEDSWDTVFDSDVISISF
jgi:hypothetical protein